MKSLVIIDDEQYVIEDITKKILHFKKQTVRLPCESLTGEALSVPLSTPLCGKQEHVCVATTLKKMNFNQTI